MQHFIKLAMILSLGVSMSAYSDNAPEEKPIVSKETCIRLATHCVTEVCSSLVAAATMITGLYMGSGNIEINEAGFKSRNGNLAPFVVAACLAVFVRYKTPQWTDTYVLEKKTKRTSKQNILNYLSRTLVTWPFGVVTGELLSDAFKPVDEKAEQSK